MSGSWLRSFSLISIFFLAQLAGCISDDSSNVTTSGYEGEFLDVVEEPCDLESEYQTQILTNIFVNGYERSFLLTTPSSQSGELLPIIIAFHAGGESGEDFPQQQEFDSLAEQEKFIIVYANSEADRTEAEGDWFLNSAATSRDDNDFALQIVEQLSDVYCVEQNKLYAIGYSLGSMFTYEVACQLNYKFAAVASFGGSMPVNPESCFLSNNIAVMHIHGKLDLTIDYDEDWEWDDGEHVGVGTMSNIPGMIEDWSERSNCERRDDHYHLEVEHVVYSNCDGGVNIEHHGMEFQGHAWPNQVAGTSTHELIWEFLDDFSKD